MRVAQSLSTVAPSALITDETVHRSLVGARCEQQAAIGKTRDCMRQDFSHAAARIKVEDIDAILSLAQPVQQRVSWLLSCRQDVLSHARMICVFL